LAETFARLRLHGVDLEGTLLKPNMVISGKKCAVQAPVEAVAARTVACFRAVVPAAIPGIVFLSGGQSDEDATAHLSAMNARGPHPWELSFSYGRALQAAALKAWSGQAGNLQAGQRAFYRRARFNGLARSGGYRSEMENEAA
jgi:fructose-bisphosphate aldolase class I